MADGTDERITTIDQPPTRTARFTHDVRVVLGTIILAALVVFAIDNRRTTHVDYIVGSTNAPLWLVLAGTAVAGALIGWLILHRPRRTRNRAGTSGARTTV